MQNEIQIWTQFQTEDPQMSGAAVQSAVDTATCRPPFVHPSIH